MCWDVTKLHGPAKWTYYYSVLDLGHLQPLRRRLDGYHPRIRRPREKLIAATRTKQHIACRHLIIHADRGSAMSSKQAKVGRSQLPETKVFSGAQSVPQIVIP